MSHRIDRRHQITGRRQKYVDLRWKAATTGGGFILTRQTRLLGAIYMLTPLHGPAELFYSMDEVANYLDRHASRAS